MQESAVLPAPPTPPTPPVSLAALLSREDLALRQLAGPPATEVTVHWAHTSEMSDPFPYLLGGELLLTAGVHIPEGAESGTYFDDYVSRIVAAGGAALGFGVAPVHDTVPRALVAACEAYGLPLVEVPPRTTFSGVARAVWRLMARARLAELRRVSEAQQGLAAAASRPDPVPSVLRRLATRLDGRAVLYGPEGAEIAAAGREPGGEVGRALAELARFVTGHASSTATDTVAGTRLAAYALGTGQGFVLGVAAPHRESGDHTIASVAAVLLSLLTGEHQSGTGAARSSALVRLLLGARPEEVAPLLGGGGGEGVTHWHVVHARPATGAPDPVSASALGTALGSPLVDTDGDVVRVLVPAARHADAEGGTGAGAGSAPATDPGTGTGPAPAPAPDPATGSGGSVAVAGPAAQPGWTLGVSAPVAPAEWPAADAQAARALARAGATRVPLVRHGARPALADLVPDGEAEAHARALLAPVASVPALTETLRAWLSLHGSWDRTAVALSVHRNTVRQRIARCAALLDADLDDPDVRMELWFALRR
ncbi:PucR family transcriptional regulator ligand-binding domain-containing protein [Streptomyces sp. BB1-1-1]|uniref:PucR family transcriptional regulator n=1 Tax=Streptomyces sp. BB1-1-1 TaxID=3074430 RepID=UPI002877B42B|nr:PucR family transcriptional regulator ligand-binding domain-containing protein [Streptomyces sp. BB1-1-1]WND37464.1 PucR family transcriptional regulator ligand-binding domain-containing protein [Streptomyces sp. BB1-1-1]